MSAEAMMQNLVDLARASTGALMAELRVDSDPPLHIISIDPAAMSSRTDAGSLALDLRDPPGMQATVIADATDSGAVASWVRSYAAVPITGPSAEAGWLALASDAVDTLQPAHLDGLNTAASLIEDRMDRTEEQVRLDALGELLRSNQRDLQATRDRLEISNQELEQFAYIAAHELVAPLRAVAVYAELLGNLVQFADDATATQASSCATEIRDGVTLMNRQVQYLLSLSKAQTDTADPEIVDLGFVVNEALDTLRAPLDEIGAEITVGELPQVMARPVPLQSVFANLISNAVRYRDPERPLAVTIEAVESAGGWDIRVTDNGLGVSETDRVRIFQLFERASRETSGSGIGLALTRRIMEAFNGTISVEAGSPHGSTFTVWFPGLASDPIQA